MLKLIINEGTTDVIIDIGELIELLNYKLIALDKYQAVGVDITQGVIDIRNTIKHLDEYLSALPYEEDEFDDI
jgi:hypothetical protein